MENCQWCDKPIEHGYLNNTGHLICLDCAEDNYKKMKELKDNLDKEMIILATGIRKLKRDLCEHENLVDTGYAKWSDKIRLVYRCQDCGKEVLKERL